MSPWCKLCSRTSCCAPDTRTGLAHRTRATHAPDTCTGRVHRMRAPESGRAHRMRAGFTPRTRTLTRRTHRTRALDSHTGRTRHMHGRVHQTCASDACTGRVHRMRGSLCRVNLDASTGCGVHVQRLAYGPARHDCTPGDSGDWGHRRGGVLYAMCRAPGSEADCVCVCVREHYTAVIMRLVCEKT